MMTRSLLAGLCLSVALGFVGSAAGADVFERHGATLVKKLVEEGTARDALTMDEAARLKPLAPNVGSPCLVVRTDDGGFAKVLVSWGLKKGANGDRPIPILFIERYVTYRGDRLELTSATGKDVMLFPGFGFNLDIGQVVPEGQGADLLFSSEGSLQPAEGTKLVPLSGSQLPAQATTRRDPTDHEGVLAEDFAGTWKVDADGRWLGELQLNMTANGKATGTFISEESKNSYEASGQTGSTPHNLKLEIFLANTQMSMDGYLWTKDKSQMAGTVTMTGRKFGFTARRVATE